MKEQVISVTDIQNKLVDKSKKLLKNTNALKNKAFQLLRLFERLSAYTGGRFNFQADDGTAGSKAVGNDTLALTA